MRRAPLAPLALAALLAACSASRPAADTAAARPDSTAPSAAAPAPAPAALDSPAATPRTDTTVPARQRDSSAASHPGLTPRRPHPVPHPMPRGDDSTPGVRPSGGSQASDQAVLDRLMREAKALAHVDGCTAADGCAVLALGERACGGPEDYVIYCPRSTDVAALKAKAADLAREQKAFNAKYQIVSTCELRQPPTATIVGGACRASRAAGAPAGPR